MEYICYKISDVTGKTLYLESFIQDSFSWGLHREEARILCKTEKELIEFLIDSGVLPSVKFEEIDTGFLLKSALDESKKRGLNFYKSLASKVYKIPYEEVTEEHRELLKKNFLSYIYGGI